MQTRLEFIVEHEAWYWNANAPTRESHAVAAVTLSRAALTDAGEPDGGVWEFRVVWYELRSGRHPRIEMFNDSWVALQELGANVFPALVRLAGECPSPENVSELLTSFGWIDATERTIP